MEKINALHEVNNLISRKLKTMNTSLNGKTKYKADTVFELSNSETSLNIFSVKANQKSEPRKEEEFQRIICLEGEIKISLSGTNREEIKLSSSNTMLIPPYTEFVIETLVDTQIAVVYKPRREVKEKILEEKTIYNKI